MRVLWPSTPLFPRTSSGTCIDIFIGHRSAPLPVTVIPEFVGLSDHRLVLLDAPLQCTAPWAAGFGRVAWTSGPEWDAGLAAVTGTLSSLAAAVEDAITCAWLRPQWGGGRATRLQRRAVVNVAAWARDAVYTLVGHVAGATKV